jgi:hypothetical protein
MRLLALAGRARLGAFACAMLSIAILGLGAASAGGEGFNGPNVHATFKGWLTPEALPRTDHAPVALHMTGALEAVNDREPPQLRQITIELHRGGEVSTTGLPVCARRKIASTTSKQALASCRSALVGVGQFTAHIAIPSQAPFPARGKMLAFNAVAHGHHVILAHIYGTQPVPTSRLLVMEIRHTREGAFDTKLSLRLPTLTVNWGYATGFRLNLRRRYVYRDRLRSVVSASCPAPAGFGRASFVAARGIYSLADGRQIYRSLYGHCKVRHH